MPEEIARLEGKEPEKTPLFRGVNTASILGLLENCPIEKFEVGDVLILAGRPNQTI